MLCDVYYDNSTQQLVMEFITDGQLCSVSATISDWIQPYSAGNAISIDSSNKIHAMYKAGRGVKFYKNGSYTAICADMSVISSDLSLFSYAKLSDILSIQPGDSIVKTVLSGNMYSICVDID